MPSRICQSGTDLRTLWRLDKKEEKNRKKNETKQNKNQKEEEDEEEANSASHRQLHLHDVTLKWLMSLS